MIKYHISNNLTDCVKDSARFQDLTEEEHIRLYAEIKNATLQGIQDNLVSKVADNIKVDNEVNSLLLWVLGITDQKPNKQQKIISLGSYPDIDSDISKLKRNLFINYIKSKYGESRVCQVATFGTMAAKGSIRNAARALGYSVASGEKVAKFIPNLPGVSIQDSLDASKEFQSLYNKDPEFKHIVDIAQKLEGLPNSIGTHASAICVTDKDITEYIPIMSASRKDADCIITQMEYKDVEALGAIKLDGLGLKTLDVIQQTVEYIDQYKNIKIKISDIDINDEGIYKLLKDSHNTGVFQLEGGTLVKMTQELLPNNIEELSDLSALARPGPMSAGLPEAYKDAKFNNKLYTYNLKDKKLIEQVWDVCKSYSILIYQEDCIRCFQKIGGFDAIRSDAARAIIGKKKINEMPKLKADFVSGGIKNGYTEEDLSELFSQIEGFSG